MNPDTFKFAMNSTVKISASGETGTVVGRAEYNASENTYYLRYMAGDGRATEAWWPESALVAG